MQTYHLDNIRTKEFLTAIKQAKNFTVQNLQSAINQEAINQEAINQEASPFSVVHIVSDGSDIKIIASNKISVFEYITMEETNLPAFYCALDFENLDKLIKVTKGVKLLSFVPCKDCILMSTISLGGKDLLKIPYQNGLEKQVVVSKLQSICFDCKEQKTLDILGFSKMNTSIMSLVSKTFNAFGVEYFKVTYKGREAAPLSIFQDINDKMLGELNIISFV